jgi:hypothetical protein
MTSLNDYFKAMGPDGDEDGRAYPNVEVFEGAILQLVKIRCGPGDDDFENEVIEVARCDREYDADVLVMKLNEHNRMPEILFNQSARYEARIKELEEEDGRLREAVEWMDMQLANGILTCNAVPQDEIITTLMGGLSQLRDAFHRRAQAGR